MTRFASPLLLSAVAALAFAAPAFAAPTTLVATLAGASEPEGGEPKGSGQFTVEIEAEAGDVCYTLAAKDIGTATAAHIHSGAAGASGPPVVTVSVAEDVCVAAQPDVLRPIVANPAGFYVNVHTSAFPKGAIRGQLQKK